MSQPKEETLTAESFRRIREIFEVALDRPRQERRA
jgi:hypothetical protein